MLEELATKISERVLDSIENIIDETTTAAREGSITFLSLVGLENIFQDKELEVIFQNMPSVVLFSDEIRELNVKEHISPVHGISPEAEKYFCQKLKYTPVRTYKIYGTDTDMKENLFKYIITNEANNNSAIIEILVDLDGATNRFIMMPWGEETHIGIDTEFNTTIQTRRSRDAPWEE